MNNAYQIRPWFWVLFIVLAIAEVSSGQGNQCPEDHKEIWTVESGAYGRNFNRDIALSECTQSLSWEYQELEEQCRTGSGAYFLSTSHELKCYAKDCSYYDKPLDRWICWSRKDISCCF